MTPEQLRAYFEVHGRDAFINNKRVRILYNGLNVRKIVKVPIGMHQFAEGDVVKMDTAHYVVSKLLPSSLPNLSEAEVKIKF